MANFYTICWPMYFREQTLNLKYFLFLSCRSIAAQHQLPSKTCHFLVKETIVRFISSVQLTKLFN